MQSRTVRTASVSFLSRSARSSGDSLSLESVDFAAFALLFESNNSERVIHVTGRE